LKGRHTWKNAPHLENCGTLEKAHHTWKNAAHSEKSATLGKMRHTWKGVAKLEKCGTLSMYSVYWNPDSRAFCLVIIIFIKTTTSQIKLTENDTEK